MDKEGRVQDLRLVSKLNFLDSDCEADMESSSSDRGNSHSPVTPGIETSKSELWDSGIFSPTPNGRSTQGRKTPLMLKPPAVSPIPFNFGGDSDDDQFGPMPTVMFTPPHKKFGSLRLHDTPQTPKSLLHHAQRRFRPISRPLSRLRSGRRQRESRPETNINPFTPNNNVIAQKPNGLKRSRRSMEKNGVGDSLEDEIEDDLPSSKRLALHEINTSRYNEEFHELCRLGDGQFGSVYKCINRLDGCVYAIKKSKTPVAGSAYERAAMNEVYAHAVVGKHPHVVRYYSAWAENDHMYIQDEYCNGGSLAGLIARNHKQGLNMSECELKQVLIQISKGLLYIHSQNLVHLDIKPGNIFIQYNPKPASPESGLDEDMCEELEQDEHELITYKIGDLGHVTSVTNPIVEEGDCRFLPLEILQEQFDHLPKADIFSLALTILAAGGCGELPKNGDKWHQIRQGDIPRLPNISEDFHNLLKIMVDLDPKARPTCATLIQHPVLCPFSIKSREQLRRELNEERFKNEQLQRLLDLAKEKELKVKRKATDRSSRLIGKKYNRSMSLQGF